MSGLLNTATETRSVLSTSNTTKHKNSMNALFGFKQSKIIVLGMNDGVQIKLNNLLKNWQCNVQCFYYAEKSILKSVQKEWQPRLIISDFSLSGSKLGIDTVKLIQDFYACDTLVIILIGDTGPIRTQLAKDSGFTILHKPINAAQLRFVIHKKLSIHAHHAVNT
jgi:CheY-like chemotaxis protein